MKKEKRAVKIKMKQDKTPATYVVLSYCKIYKYTYICMYMYLYRNRVIITENCRKKNDFKTKIITY